MNIAIDVLSFGELLVDLISEDNIKFSKCLGGSPTNIAVNMRKLGFISQLISCVGDDFLGDFIVGELNKYNLSNELIQKSTSSTSVVILNRSKATPIPIFYRGADKDIKWQSVWVDLIDKTKIFHFSSWPLSYPESRAALDQILSIAKCCELKIGFDPNYHPALWNSESDVIAIFAKYIAIADYIKPSLDDAERLFGKFTPKQQIANFHKLGAKIILLTLGKDGVMFSDGNNTFIAPSQAKAVVDTTGAGDAFWSGFYGAILSDMTAQEAVSYGSKVSAINLRNVGNTGLLPTMQQLMNGDIDDK